MIQPVDEIFYPADTNVAVVNGEMIPIGPKQVSAGEILSQLRSVVCLPYTGTEKEKKGMTLIEAALYSAAKQAADGDTDALEKVLNRICGKPLQAVVTASGSLREFLDHIAQENRPPSIEDL
jgi:hypothetical protein